MWQLPRSLFQSLEKRLRAAELTLPVVAKKLWHLATTLSQSLSSVGNGAMADAKLTFPSVDIMIATAAHSHFPTIGKTAEATTT